MTYSEETQKALNWLKRQKEGILIKVNVNSYRTLKRLSIELWLHHNYNIIFFDGTEIRFTEIRINKNIDINQR